MLSRTKKSMPKKHTMMEPMIMHEKLYPCPHCQGSGFLSDAFNFVKRKARELVPTVGNLVHPGLGNAVDSALKHFGVGKPKKAKRKLSEKQKKRNDLVKKVMKQRKVSLPEASKIVKEEGLY